MTLVPGARLGPYEIMSPLGSGGMGEVYKARDMRLGRVVAVKVLAGRHAEDAAMRERFEREARASRSRLTFFLTCVRILQRLSLKEVHLIRVRTTAPLTFTLYRTRFFGQKVALRCRI